MSGAFFTPALPLRHRMWHGEISAIIDPEGFILIQKNESTESCSFREGALPNCAPLGMAYVPMQASAEPAYEPNKALQRGTLFPGLDLPFMNVVNKGNLGDTPLGELMALDFVITELNLYLDTHKDDTAAFKVLQSTLALYEEGKTRFVKQYGPITIYDLKQADHFSWLHDPWPWDYHEEMEG